MMYPLASLRALFSFLTMSLESDYPPPPARGWLSRRFTMLAIIVIIIIGGFIIFLLVIAPGPTTSTYKAVP